MHGPEVQGTAEVALIAETLNAAAARLAEARERERRMEQGRRDLIAWASHDLRTPLASLRALAEALADDLAPDEATRRRYLVGLTANVERLSALVDDLFELSAIQAGAVSLQLEPTSLPDLAAEVLDRFEPEAAAAGVVLEAELHGGRPVPAGRDQLGRVLANLVVNGIRHTPRGGRVLVAAGEDHGMAVLQVRDGCGGIPEADLPHVFDQLWRGDPAARATAPASAWPSPAGWSTPTAAPSGSPTSPAAASSPSTCRGEATPPAGTAGSGFPAADRLLTAWERRAHCGRRLPRLRPWA
jgi:signal transduction histidine kinase